MQLPRLLPWDYATRNLLRRPLRTALTLLGLTTVVLMVLLVVGFVRGLERTLQVSGQPDVGLVFALGMGENIEYSSIPARTGDLVASSVPGIRLRQGQAYVSPELYLGTHVSLDSSERPALGLVRGVTPRILLVRSRVDFPQGTWPGPGEVLVGRLAATKLGKSDGPLQVGDPLEFEGRRWRVSGTFTAGGSALESEIWCPLDQLQQALKRQDLSLVAVTLQTPRDFARLDLFCKQRLDLELQAMRETDYFDTLRAGYRPVQILGWMLAGLVLTAGVITGLNTMYGAVVGRTAELAMLQTLGFSRRAILISLVQEGLLLSTAASLLASLLSLVLLEGRAVRFTMGAFALSIDGATVLIGCAVALPLGLFGSLPPAWRAFRMSIVRGLRTV